MSPKEALGDIYQYENVKLVRSILTLEDFIELFPFGMRLIYHQYNFLKAVAQYPAFCGEYRAIQGIYNLSNQRAACKRELATLFAHMIFESGHYGTQNSNS